MKPPYSPQNRYFPLTSLLQRQNMPKMREKQKNMGLTANFSRYLRHFFDLQTLRAGKQPRIRTRRSTVRRTTCRLTLIEMYYALPHPTHYYVRRGER